MVALNHGQEHARSSQKVSLTTGAALVDVSERTLRRRIADGTLPAYRLGPRMIRISVADLEAAFGRIPAA